MPRLLTVSSVKASFELNEKPKAGLNGLPLSKARTGLCSVVVT